MPYIKDAHLRELLISGKTFPRNAGELTFMLFYLCRKYVEVNGKTFTVLAEVLGALSATSLEFYRKDIAPYEDTKIVDNGDVIIDS